MSSLDRFLEDSQGPKPKLIKVDVEGYEFEVLRGARQSLVTPPFPVVVFESNEGRLAACGTRYREIVDWFHDEVGYKLFSLTPRGLVPVEHTANSQGSLNSLAVRLPDHEPLIARLKRHRFRRNQNC